MPFQTAVSTYPAVGVAGQIGTLNPATFFPKNAHAGADMTIGIGAFYDTSAGTMSNVAGTNGTFAGIAIRVLDYANYSVLSEASMVVAEGQPVAVLTRGDVYVTAPAAVAYGSYVFASTTTGALTFATSSTAATGTVLTPFKAAGVAAAGDVVLISTNTN